MSDIFLDRDSQPEGDTITRLQTKWGTIVLLGTAHVSEDSSREVEQLIRTEKPNSVCVELDQNRYRSLNEESRWKSLNIYQVIKQKQTFLLLSNLVLSAYQKRLGLSLGTRPGDEMRVAIRTAEELDIPTVMVDRDISVTLTRAWRKTGLWGKNKLLAVLIGSAFSSEKLDKETIENLKRRSALDDMMTEVARFLPSVKEVLIDERDEYLAVKSWENMRAMNKATDKQDPIDLPRILVVVGAGHLPGMIRKIQELDREETDRNFEPRLREISEIPPKGKLSRVIPWLIGLTIISLLVAGFVIEGWEGGFEGLLRWVLINGSFSAIGAILALAHPLTILSSFLAAPITSMNPTIGVGFVTGLLESLLRKPKVQDFENLGDDITSVKGFFRNRITHVLLVFLFSSIGSAVGTFIALPLIFPG